MKRIFTFAIVIALYLSSAAWSTAAFADEDSDKAFKAVREGKITPLSTIMETVLKTYGGQILGVELEEQKFDEMGLPIEGEGGSETVTDTSKLSKAPGDIVLYYEIKLLTPQGNVLKLKYNAHTAGLLKIQGRPEAQQTGPIDYEIDDFQEFDNSDGGND